jgi:GntR family transcriptional regulator
MDFRTDPASPFPLYLQVQDTIRRQIIQGEYQPGTVIPSEPRLERLFGVSRITVRKALEGLVLEGLLVRQRGVGTTVIRTPFIDNSFRLAGFTERSDEHHAPATAKVLEKRRIPASRRIADILRMESGSEIIYLRRLRFSAGNPISLTENYLRGDIGIPDSYDFQGSIYYLLEHICQIEIRSADKIISAGLAGEEESGLLETEPGAPVLQISSTTADGRGRPVEYAEGIFPADRYRYAVRLERSERRSWPGNQD